MWAALDDTPGKATLADDAPTLSHATVALSPIPEGRGTFTAGPGRGADVITAGVDAMVPVAC